jgi:hypothetical protein
MALGGVVRRPEGSDGYWPPVGTYVTWRPARGVQDSYDQAKEAGIRQLGVIGNDAHLQKHGDHTPWSVIGGVTKVRGVVYAIDLGMPTDFGPWLVAKCRSDYFTKFIGFWNFGGHQYDYAGNRLGPSADHHFHLSIAYGHENTPVTLISDYLAEKEDPMALDLGTQITIDTDISALTGGVYKVGEKVTLERFLEVIFHRADAGSAAGHRVYRAIADAASAEAARDAAAVSELTARLDRIEQAVATPSGLTAEAVARELIRQLGAST